MARSSLKVQAYNKIKEDILNCKYVPGSLVTEDILQKELEVSRTPIREAVSRLEQEGLVMIKPKKGIVIQDLTFEDVGSVYEARLLLEPYAITTYGNRIDTSTYLEFHKNFSYLKDNNLGDSTLDDKFHGLFLTCSKNDYFMQANNSICNQNTRLRILTSINDNSNLIDTAKEHLEIVEACLETDWSLAAQKCIDHLEKSRSRSLKLLLSKSNM